jgi:ArsR family transcriptional regulator, arsenate/arsenite/antimonite-responsive transcriptional repressor
MNADKAKAIPADWQRLTAVFVALGDEQRQRIMLTFDQKGEELSAGELANASQLSRPAVSHHLKILHSSGCLQREKRGKEVFYRVDRERLLEAFGVAHDYIEKHS